MKKKNGGQFVAKVQVSLATSSGKKEILVYNEDRSVFWIEDDREIVKAVQSFLKGALKVYCLVHMNETVVNLDSVLPETEWPDW